MKKRHFLYLSGVFFLHLFVGTIGKINRRRMPGTCLQRLIFAVRFFFPLSSLPLRRDHCRDVPGDRPAIPHYSLGESNSFEPDLLLSSRAWLAGGTRWLEEPHGTGRCWDLFTSCPAPPQRAASRGGGAHL